MDPGPDVTIVTFAGVTWQKLNHLRRAAIAMLSER